MNNPGSLILRWWREFCFKGQLEVVDAQPLEGTNSASSSIIGCRKGQLPLSSFYGIFRIKMESVFPG